MSKNISGWEDDDDFLDGDIEFDTDFDGEKKKGFFSDLVSGFLSGVVETTVGSTDARIKTLRRIVPSTYGEAFDVAEKIRKDLTDNIAEFKENSAEMMQDLAYISGKMAEKLKEKLPNKIVSGMETFSNKDFSQWEKSTNFYSSDESMGEVTQEDVGYLVREAMENSSQMTVASTEMLSGVINSGFSRAISSTLGSGRNLVKIDNTLKQIYNYQVKVQARNDAIKINLMARMHMTNARYYKFMEIAVHRQITELKNIVKYTSMSDYQKTKTLDAAKKVIRDSIFNSTVNRYGGFAKAFKSMFAKENINEGIEAGTAASGAIRGGLETAESFADMPGFSIVNMIGALIGNIVAEHGPEFLFSIGGAKALAKMKKLYPKETEAVLSKYEAFKDFGKSVSYGAKSVNNVLTSVYEDGGLNKITDSYEDYVESLEPGTKPMSKFSYNALKKGKNLGTGFLNAVGENMYSTSGTTYQLANRDLKSLLDPSIWNSQNSRTLNEVIPKFLSMIATSNESIRLALNGPTVESLTYDFKRSTLVKETKAKRDALLHTLDKNQLEGYAYSVKNIGDALDNDNTLSQDLKTKLSMKIADRSDKLDGGGFNPYDFIMIGSQYDEGSKEDKAISDFMKKKFNITDEDVIKSSNGDFSSILKRMSVGANKDLLNDINNKSQSLSKFTPNLMEKIDTQIALGNESVLREAGLITGEGFNRTVSRDRIFEEISKYVNDKITGNNGEIPLTNEKSPLDNGYVSTTKRFLPDSFMDQPEENTETQDALKDLVLTIKQTNANFEKMAGNFGINLDLSKVEQFMSDTNVLLGNIKDLNSEQLNQLVEIVKTQALINKANNVGKEDTTTDAEEANVKKSIFEKAKALLPRNLFNQGVEKLLSAQPLVLGGLLGGLATTAFFNPKAAMLLGGGALAMGAYLKMSDLRKNYGKEPSDDEDIYDEEGNVLLSSTKMKQGDYWDLTSKAIIKAWKDIKGTVVTVTKAVVATAKQLGGKIFGPDGRQVMLKGLNFFKDAAVKTFKFIDPVTRLKKIGSALGTYFYQMDVYKSGENTPVLYRTGFKKGEYYINKDNELVPIKGWNEIDGPVYDAQQNVLVTQEDIDNGLVTSGGMKIRTATKFMGKAGSLGFKVLGQLKDRLLSGGKKAYEKAKKEISADYTPITDRLDLIYRILCRKFKYKVAGFKDDNKHAGHANAILDAIDKAKPETANGDKPRAGSFADKENIKKEKRNNKVQDAIVNIGDALLGKKDKNGKPVKGGEGEGLFGSLLSFFKNPFKGLITAFGGGALALAGGFFKMMMNGVPLLLKGVTGIAKATWAVTKVLTKGFWSLGKLLVRLVSSMMGYGGGDDGGYVDDGYDGEERDKKGKKKTNKKTKTKTTRSTRTKNKTGRIKGSFGKIKTKGAGAFRKIGGFVSKNASKVGGFVSRNFNKLGNFKGGAVSLAVGAGLGIARNAFDVEEGSTADTVLSAGETAANVVGTYGMVAGAANMMGASLPTVGALASSAGSVAMAGLEAAAPLLLNPVTLGVAVVAIGVYAAYKYYSRGKGDQYPLRMAQYGFDDASSEMAVKTRAMEEKLKKYIKFSEGKASFAANTPAANMLMEMRKEPANGIEAANLFKWFNYRFKPVYMIYMNALQQVKFKTLEEYDKSTEPRVLQVAKQVNSALLNMNPCPYEIQLPVYDGKMTIGKDKTVSLVNEYLENLGKYNDRHGFDENGKVVAPTTKIEKSMEELNKESKEAGFFKKRWMIMTGKYVSDKKLKEYNEKYKAPEELKSDDISDLIPKDGSALDTLTAIRVALYANHQNMPYKVEALLKLERYMEKLTSINGNDVRFTGELSPLYNLFKTTFHLDDDFDGKIWIDWFNTRFLPVYFIWYREVYNNKKDVPSKTWKTLSKTMRYRIASKLMEAHGIGKAPDKDGKTYVSAWDVVIDPFGDHYFPYQSGKSKAIKWLKALEFEANEAKLKDPVAEAKATSDKDEAELSKTKNYAGGEYGTRIKKKFKAFNKEKEDKYYGGNQHTKLVQSMINSKGKADDVLINGESIKKATDKDTGIKLSKSEAVEKIKKAMKEAGYTDPKQIAEMLALTHYETGGYTKTAENMNYKDPSRAKSIFRKLKNMSLGQIKDIINKGGQAFANAVYGGWMGNTEPNDGWDFRGRGLVQLTGRNNYTLAAKDINEDIVNHPEKVSEDPEVMAKTAVWFFKNNKQLQSIKDNGDFSYAAKGLNGGKDLPGMEQRTALYNAYLNDILNGGKGDESSSNLAKTDGSTLPPSEVGVGGALPGGDTSEIKAGDTEIVNNYGKEKRDFSNTPVGVGGVIPEPETTISKPSSSTIKAPSLNDDLAKGVDSVETVNKPKASSSDITMTDDVLPKSTNKNVGGVKADKTVESKPPVINNEIKVDGGFSKKAEDATVKQAELLGDVLKEMRIQNQLQQKSMQQKDDQVHIVNV